MRLAKLGATLLAAAGIGCGFLLAVTAISEAVVALKAWSNMERVIAAKAVIQRIDFSKARFSETTRTILDRCGAGETAPTPSVVVVFSSHSLGSIRSVASWQHLLPELATNGRCVWLISVDESSVVSSVQEALDRVHGRYRLMIVNAQVVFAVRTGLRDIPATILIDPAGLVRALTIGELSMARAEQLLRWSSEQSHGVSVDVERAAHSAFRYIE